MKLLKPIISAIVVLWILSYLLPTVSYLNWTTLVLASIVLVLLNKLVKPIAKILFLPINIVTLGLFSVVINVAILWLVTYLVPGFHIKNVILFSVPLNRFFSILFVSFIIGLIQSVVGFIL